jgi:hypothetical protein
LNAELLDRRDTLLRFKVKGSKLQDVAEEMTKDISDPYERQKQIAVIRRDWNNRGRWMDNVVRISDGTFLTELVAGMDEAMKRCWIEYARGDNASARVGALRTIIMGKTRVGLLLMKAGVIQVAPQQIEASMTIAGTPFDVDPEMRKAILESTELQRLEKERQNVKS